MAFISANPGRFRRLHEPSTDRRAVFPPRCSSRSRGRSRPDLPETRGADQAPAEPVCVWLPAHRVDETRVHRTHPASLRSTGQCRTARPADSTRARARRGAMQAVRIESDRVRSAKRAFINIDSCVPLPFHTAWRYVKFRKSKFCHTSGLWPTCKAARSGLPSSVTYRPLSCCLDGLTDLAEIDSALQP